MSLRKAINAKCAECIYSPNGGTGGKLQQIAACTSFSCPLYPVRPKPKVRSSKDESLILRRKSEQIDAKPDSHGRRQ
jgi:hypothetical protein